MASIRETVILSSSFKCEDGEVQYINVELECCWKWHINPEQNVSRIEMLRF